MPELYDYQQRVRDDVVATDDRVCIVAPTGSGKTVIGSSIASHYGSVCWVAHREELIDQAKTALKLWAPNTLRRVITVQSINHPSKHYYDLLVVDECVCGHSIVGAKKAKDVRCGDYVDAINHATGMLEKARVVRANQRYYFGEVISIRVGDSILSCTPNHPIWVEGKGYVQANEVVSGDVLCVLEAVPSHDTERREGTSDMLGGVSLQDCVIGNGAHEPSTCIEKDERAQSDANCGNSPEGIRDLGAHRSFSTSARRKREGSNRCGDCHCDRNGHANECDCSDEDTGHGVSELLQGGRGRSGAEDCYRGRRFESLCDKAQIARREERVVPSLKRVASVASYQPSSADGVVVYNFEVEGCHTYFATRILTHNCHHYAADDWNQVVTNVQHARLIGLTATPSRGDGKGLKSVFDRLVVAASYSDLLERGRLVPCRITAGPEDKEGIAAEPLKAWQEHGEDALTLAFAPTIELATRWCDEFNEAGIPSACVFGTTKDRAQILDRFRAHELKVVWNVQVLTEGFDVPEVACILLARSCGVPALYLQIVGRGLRTAPAKTHCRLIDLCGNYRVHGLPTEDRKYSLEGKAIRRSKVQRLRQCLKCGAVCVAWVGKCPECGFVTPMRRMPVQVHDDKLLEVFDGENTAPEAKDSELERLREIQRAKGYKIGWVASQYKKLFGRIPVIRDATPEEKRDHFNGLIAYTRNYGRACYMYKALFAEFPTRR